MIDFSLSTKVSILAALIGQPIIWLAEPQKSLGTLTYYVVSGTMLLLFVLAIGLHFYEKSEGDS